MSWFFNSDLEDFFKNGKDQYQINSNKKNQELEYFILWLENEALYTTKRYDEKYLNFIQKFNPAALTNIKKNIKLWCSEIYNYNFQRKINSKVETTLFNIENDLAHSSTSIINDIAFLEDNYIYKEPYGVSGIGTWKFSQKPKDIKLPLVKEKLLNRQLDFSTLVLPEGDIIYLNEVDEYFQYKGTTIGINFSHYDWYENYLNNVKLIKNSFKELKPPFSIDSFIYKENEENKLYSMSEINGRKTMGYCAYKLKEKYFSKYRYARLRLIPSRLIKNKVEHEDLFNQFEGKLIPLAPFGNTFSAYIFAEENLGELNELEDNLFFTLLDCL